MALTTKQDIIEYIDSKIVPNNQKLITASVLNPLLKAIVNLEANTPLFFKGINGTTNIIIPKAYIAFLIVAFNRTTSNINYSVSTQIGLKDVIDGYIEANKTSSVLTTIEPSLDADKQIIIETNGIIDISIIKMPLK